jgi:DNA (cytosine-5)-methyltransferase 1
MYNGTLTAFTKIGENHSQPRLWIESTRLSALGFAPSTPLVITPGPNRIEITVSKGESSRNHVSKRSLRHGIRPIIDINNGATLSDLLGYDAIRVDGSYQRLTVQPTVLAFHVAKAKQCEPPFKVFELFAGGGTLSGAIGSDHRFQIVGGAELEPDYADVWEQCHRASGLMLGDIRLAHPAEIPACDVLVAGIPCTSHSNMGRAKKGLAQKPEAGDTGDLFLYVISLIRLRPPLAVVLENVPSFGTSLAGISITRTLEQLGYGVFQTVLEPNTEWNEPSNRRRWLLVATLKGTCAIKPPCQPNVTPVSALLDPPDDEKDKADVERIATCIEGLIAHNKRHAAAGHGFGFTVLDGHETTVPVIPKSYSKINTGPFRVTKFGLRLLRQQELERIHGHQVATTSASLAAEIIGQGVQPRIFREVFRQLGDFLHNN